MALPQKLPLSLMQTQWASQLNPLLANPISGVNILNDISLKSGNNVINHLLGRVQQGWFIVDIQGSASLYRPSTAKFNDTTLTINSNAAVTVSIGVF